MTERDELDIESIVRDVTSGLRKEEIDEIVSESVSSRPETKILSDAYVPAKKTYPLTSDSLSESAKQDHLGLYRDEVATLERVSAELDGVDRLSAKAEHSAFRSTKLDEQALLNGVYLHELYFANCFDPHSELFRDALPYMRLARDWGTFEAWQADFIACGMAARSGWVVCGYSLYLKRFVNTVVDGDDRGGLIGLVPILAIDLFEHAYFEDFGTDRRSYLVSQMREIAWDVVEDRVERVEALREVMG